MCQARSLKDPSEHEHSGVWFIPWHPWLPTVCPLYVPWGPLRTLLAQGMTGVWGENVYICLWFFSPFLSELIGVKYVTGEAISVHPQNRISWYCLSGWRQTSASFRTPQVRKSMLHTTAQNWDSAWGMTFLWVVLSIWGQRFWLLLLLEDH